MRILLLVRGGGYVIYITIGRGEALRVINVPKGQGVSSLEGVTLIF